MLLSGDGKVTWFKKNTSAFFIFMEIKKELSLLLLSENINFLLLDLSDHMIGILGFF